MALKIALDYDNTYTASPRAWEYLINEMRSWDWDIRIVTMRCGIQDNILDAPGDLFREALPIIYCNGVPKKEVCEAWNWVPDIWIDDKPESIHMGSSLTPEMLEAWRANGRR